MKSFFLHILLSFAFSLSAHAQMNIQCWTSDELLEVLVYSMPDGANETVVSVLEPENKEYTYAGNNSVLPRPDILLSVRGRGLYFALFNKDPQETYYQAELSVEHLTHTLDLTCDYRE